MKVKVYFLPHRILCQLNDVYENIKHHVAIHLPIKNYFFLFPSIELEGKMYARIYFFLKRGHLKMFKYKSNICSLQRN